MRLLKEKQFLYHIIAKTKPHYMQNGSRKKNEMHYQMEHLLKKLISQKVNKPMMLTSQEVDKSYTLPLLQKQMVRLLFNLSEALIHTVHYMIQLNHLWHRMMMALEEVISE